MVTKPKQIRLGQALTVLLLSVGAVATATQAPAVQKTPAAAPLVVSEARTLTREGGRNPTVAVDRRSGAVYLAWAQEVTGGGRPRP